MLKVKFIVLSTKIRFIQYDMEDIARGRIKIKIKFNGTTKLGEDMLRVNSKKVKYV